MFYSFPTFACRPLMMIVISCDLHWLLALSNVIKQLFLSCFVYLVHVLLWWLCEMASLLVSREELSESCYYPRTHFLVLYNINPTFIFLYILFLLYIILCSSLVKFPLFVQLVSYTARMFIPSISSLTFSSYPHWCSILTFYVLIMILSLLWTISGWHLLPMFLLTRQSISPEGFDFFNTVSVTFDLFTVRIFLGRYSGVIYFCVLHGDFIEILHIIIWLMTFELFHSLIRFSFSLFANHYPNLVWRAGDPI